MRLIDTHCHLNDSGAFPDPSEAIRQASEAGVDRLIVVAVDEEWSQIAVELAERHEGVFAVVGWHPTHASGYTAECLEVIRQLAGHPKACAIGEIGYDFYWDKSTREEQDRCLFDHLDLAEELEMPVVFHCREAYPQLLAELEARRPTVPMLFHCFAGGLEEAKRAMDLDCWFGFDGPITYPKSELSREVLKTVPRDRVVIETDSPYLTPIPFRGKKNTPAYVSYVNQKVAEVWGVSDEEAAQITTKNAETFFRLPV